MKELRTTFAALGLAICALAYAHAQQIGTADLLRGLADPSRWLIHSGDYTSKRHSPLTQITPENVARLTPLWMFETGLGFGRNAKFEATPIAIDGVLYLTGLLNHAWAIDGRTGRQIWHYERKLPPATRVCCGMVNRGFAVFGDRLFMTTLDSHVMALDRKTGTPIWDVPMADYRLGYSSTVAPLVVKDKLIVGMAGGELATRGFLDAYSLETGKRIWRFNTIPAPGEPGGDTWPAGHYERGGGATWITGSYDPGLNLLYWGVGNPNPDFYGGNRRGDNLYTASVVALDPDTGRLRWHFQYTPHDEHDWDSNQIQVLADLTIAGRARKTLITANRNGFFYVLDRTNGEFIQARPYVTTTWAKDVDARGRPIELPNQRPTPEGTRTCPDLAGGSSFTSPSFDPVRRLFFVSARETCQVYVSAPPDKYRARRLRAWRRHARSRRHGCPASHRSRHVGAQVGGAVWRPLVQRCALDRKRPRVCRRPRLHADGGEGGYRSDAVAPSSPRAVLGRAEHGRGRRTTAAAHARGTDADRVCARHAADARHSVSGRRSADASLA